MFARRAVAPRKRETGQRGERTGLVSNKTRGKQRLLEVALRFGEPGPSTPRPHLVLPIETKPENAGRTHGELDLWSQNLHGLNRVSQDRDSPNRDRVPVHDAAHRGTDPVRDGPCVAVGLVRGHTLGRVVPRASSGGAGGRVGAEDPEVAGSGV